MGLEILYLLIPATFLLAVVALLLFVWAIHSGQFDDLETPAIRVLYDDERPREQPPGAAPTDPAPERAPAARAERAASETAETTAERTE